MSDLLGYAARSLAFDNSTGESGDWHDVIDLPSGDVAVVVGDAMGHGQSAAELRAALQPAVRRLALAGRRPADILLGAQKALEAGTCATLVMGIIGSWGADFAFASAGHPPPLLIDRHGSARFLGAGRNPLLGIPATREPQIGHARLRVGDTVVLYTDGLIEGPDRDIDAGLGRLADRAARMADAPLGDLCECLVGLGLQEGGARDDLTAVAMRVHAPRVLLFDPPLRQAVPTALDAG
jgi:serine phosphatase RsbU (regulator of sigma subunit)